MIEIEGRVLAPKGLADRRIRIWLGQLQSKRFGRHSPPHIGDLYDRTGEFPGAGLEASLYIPKDAWLPAMDCLSTAWRRLKLTVMDGNGYRMRVADFSFHSDNSPPA
jgi:hypothetical protein